MSIRLPFEPGLCQHHSKLNGVDWTFRREESWRRTVLLWAWSRNSCELVWVIVSGSGLSPGRNMLSFSTMSCRLALRKSLKNTPFRPDTFLLSILKNFIRVPWPIFFYRSLKRFLTVSFLDDFVIKYDITLRIDLHNLFIFSFWIFLHSKHSERQLSYLIYWLKWHFSDFDSQFLISLYFIISETKTSD